MKEEVKQRNDIKEDVNRTIEYAPNKISTGNCAPAEEACMIQALAQLVEARARMI